MEGFDLRNLLNHEHWLAMDADGEWRLYTVEPSKGGWCWVSGSKKLCLPKSFFNLPKHEDWRESLIQVKDLIKD